jgi:KipI family sensor histidine kinase inhibitor
MIRPASRITPLGDSAALIQLGSDINLSVHRRIHTLANLIEVSPMDGIIEAVPGYATLLIHYDPLTVSFASIRDFLREKLLQAEETLSRKPRQIEVPVRYGGEEGVDLEAAARHLRLQVEEVIRLHRQKIYTVFMMGFTPGFPYMGKLDDALVMPRLAMPRPRVRAGTVAIAGWQTGIYPLDSPGGWHLIGWTPLTLFAPRSDSPFLFAPGDEVKFIEEK